MRLTVEPRHEHNEATQIWLPTYVREIFDITVDRVRRYLPELPADPWESYTGGLTVWLHNPPGVPIYDGDGNLVKYTSGLITPLNANSGFGNPSARVLVEIDWNDQFTLGKQNLVHELQHFLAFNCGDPYWGYFGHSDKNSRVFQYGRDWLAEVHPHDQVNLWSRNAGGLVY